MRMHETAHALNRLRLRLEHRRVMLCCVMCRRGLYPGHGYEVVEVTVARAERGTDSLPPHLHSCYHQAGPHPWPLPPSADQVRSPVSAHYIERGPLPYVNQRYSANPGILAPGSHSQCADGRWPGGSRGEGTPSMSAYACSGLIDSHAVMRATAGERCSGLCVSVLVRRRRAAAAEGPGVEQTSAVREAKLFRRAHLSFISRCSGCAVHAHCGGARADPLG